MDGHHVTSKQKGQVRIKMCDNNGDTFIATLHNVLSTPDLCDMLFLNNYVNELGTYLFITQRVLYCLLLIKREK